jgi:hypothetical protein
VLCVFSQAQMEMNKLTTKAASIAKCVYVCVCVFSLV